LKEWCEPPEISEISENELRELIENDNLE